MSVDEQENVLTVQVEFLFLFFEVFFMSTLDHRIMDRNYKDLLILHPLCLQKLMLLKMNL